MIFKRHTIFVIHRFLLSNKRTVFLQIARYQLIRENIGCEHIIGGSTSTPAQSDSNPDYMVAGIHSENRRRNFFSIPYEDVHDDNEHCPRAPQPAFPRGNFSFAKASKTTRRYLCRTYLPLAGKQTCRHAVGQHQNIQHFFWLDGVAIRVLSLRTVPTFDIESHIAENEPHPRTTDRHLHSSIIVGLFFETTLNFRVRTSDHGPGFPQSKSKLFKKSLALANP